MRDHLTDEILAGLIDGVLEPGEREPAIRHLRECESCRTAYREAGRLASVWGEVPEDFPADTRILALGRDRRSGRTGSEPSDPSLTGRRSLGPRLVMMAAAIVAIAVIAFWSARRPDWDGNGALGPAFAAVLEASNRGPFVLPGVEDELDPAVAVTRSGYVESSDSLRSALRRLRAQYERHESAAPAAQWAAAAEIATGRLDAARALLEDARSLREENPDLATLAAIVAYIDGDPEQAESLLRWVLERRPGDDAARLNLALVLRDLGRSEEAAGLLRRVAAHRPGTPVALRAQVLLALPSGS